MDGATNSYFRLLLPNGIYLHACMEDLSKHDKSMTAVAGRRAVGIQRIALESGGRPKKSMFKTPQSKYTLSEATHRA